MKKLLPLKISFILLITILSSAYANEFMEKLEEVRKKNDNAANLLMGENLSLACKGEREVSGGGLVYSIKPDTRTYILEDEKLIKAKELMPVRDNWTCEWHKSNIFCLTNAGTIGFDRLSGAVESYVSRGGKILEFKGQCEVVIKKKF